MRGPDRAIRGLSQCVPAHCGATEFVPPNKPHVNKKAHGNDITSGDDIVSRTGADHCAGGMPSAERCAAMGDCALRLRGPRPYSGLGVPARSWDGPPVAPSLLADVSPAQARDAYLLARISHAGEVHRGSE